MHRNAVDLQWAGYAISKRLEAAASDSSNTQIVVSPLPAVDPLCCNDKFAPTLLVVEYDKDNV